MEESEIGVFISYSHADGGSIATAVEQALTRHRSGQLFPWIDHELERGEQFDASIQDAIATCDVAICVVTPAFNTSDYIQNIELPALLKRSRSTKSPMVVVPVLAGGSLQGGLEIFHAGEVGEVLSADTADPDGRAYKKFADDVYRVGKSVATVQRKHLSPAQRRAKVKTFVKNCAQWDGEEEHYQDFWRGLMGLLGYTKPTMLQFQKKVRDGEGHLRKLDCYVPGRFVGESKSRSERNLDAGQVQALRYVQLLEEIPQVVITSNFAAIRISTLTEDGEVAETVEFPVSELGDNLSILEALFADDYPHGVRQAVLQLAPEMANKTHIRLITHFRDILIEEGMSQQQAFTLTMRVLFLLVADDLGILNVNPSDHTTGRFDQFLRPFTSGADATAQLQVLFSHLNEPGMWARDGGFPYVNGGLFADQMAFPPLTDRALRALQDASAADWSDLDPFLFGSLYQQTHTLDDRAEHGQHFTSAVNIRKALDPLFLDTFRTRLDAARGRREQLLELQRDLARLRVLDPAAGCGNFLLVAYQDVKTIEREVITELLATGMQAHSTLINVPEGEYAGRTTIALRPPKPTPRAKQPPDVYVPLVQMTHFAGIELDEPAAALARTVLILAAVQAEFALGETTDLTRTPLPLSDDTNATVHATNALQFNWANAWIDYDGVFNEHTVIVGNPPFLGPRQRNDSQRADHQHVWGDVPSAGSTDYVTNWFLLAGRYMQHTHARAAFVSTNSLTQGEQPAIVWTQLHQLGMHIDFAYRTFPWANGAGQQAAVHCVIIGFSANPRPSTVRLWDEHNNCRDVPHINAYLTDGDEVLVWGRSEPLSARTPWMRSGSIPRDGGHLSKINETEAQRIREHDTTASKYLRRLYGADELIKGNIRYCLWLVDVAPADVRNSTELKTRIADVKSYRETKPYLRKQATTPHLFADRYQPHNPFLAVPSVSSQTRDYLPCAYLTENDIVNNAVFTITNCPTWLFGVLSSRVFMAWNRLLSSRMKSDYQISASITYNTFPFPSAEEHLDAITAAADTVLTARNNHPTATLADLYTADTFYLYADLKAAHDALDAAVLAAYGLKKSATDADITRTLFDRYSEMVGQESTQP